jgi:hypothetical protein
MFRELKGGKKCISHHNVSAKKKMKKIIKALFLLDG